MEQTVETTMRPGQEAIRADEPTNAWPGGGRRRTPSFKAVPVRRLVPEHLVPAGPRTGNVAHYKPICDALLLTDHVSLVKASNTCEKRSVGHSLFTNHKSHIIEWHPALRAQCVHALFSQKQVLPVLLPAVQVELQSEQKTTIGVVEHDGKPVKV